MTNDELKETRSGPRAGKFASILNETSETVTAENRRRMRMGLPPKPNPLFSPTPAYVAIERAVVLGSDQTFEGRVFIAEPDGRLKPINGNDLAALHRDFPNFVRRWRIPESW